MIVDAVLADRVEEVASSATMMAASGPKSP